MFIRKTLRYQFDMGALKKGWRNGPYALFKVQDYGMKYISQHSGAINDENTKLRILAFTHV